MLWLQIPASFHMNQAFLHFQAFEIMTIYVKFVKLSKNLGPIRLVTLHHFCASIVSENAHSRILQRQSRRYIHAKETDHVPWSKQPNFFKSWLRELLETRIHTYWASEIFIESLKIPKLIPLKPPLADNSWRQWRGESAGTSLTAIWTEAGNAKKNIKKKKKEVQPYI